MTIFPLGIIRKLEWFEVHFLRRHPDHVELEDESEEELKDMHRTP